jgi:ABC-type bacteriocin/lantibiotic exporter with double-glycine peptidase domain
VSPGRRVQFLFVLAAIVPSWAVDAVWLDVPFIAQEKNGCGSAALAMTMRYWGKPADAVRIQRALYSPAEKGIPATAIRRYLEDRGFEAHVFRGEWQDLRHHLSRGRPLIVCFRPSRKSALHYAVAAGADDDVVALNDPADRKLRKWDRARFEKSWSAAGFWTLLAVPRDGP